MTDEEWEEFMGGTHVPGQRGHFDREALILAIWKIRELNQEQEDDEDNE
jgi:hypothetical protein